jgi:hypothetical protein
VVFKYDYTGIISDRKYLEVNLYQNDCISPADESLILIKAVSGDELNIDIQERVSNSVHYQGINATATLTSRPTSLSPTSTLKLTLPIMRSIFPS